MTRVSRPLLDRGGLLRVLPLHSLPTPSGPACQAGRLTDCKYSRTMVAGASTSSLTIVLVDARKGLTEQSRRHAFLAAC